MDRDVALRIDGILMSIRGNLDALAQYVKNNCAEAEFKRVVRQIGTTMGETIEISNALYQSIPTSSRASCSRQVDGASGRSDTVLLHRPKPLMDARSHL